MRGPYPCGHDAIQVDTCVSTAGEIVSAMLAYSEGDPVIACWNRWFKCEQIMTVSKQRLSKDPIGKLQEREMSEVEPPILLSLGLHRSET